MNVTIRDRRVWVPYAPSAGSYGNMGPSGAVPEPDDILTADEAAAFLKVSTKTLLKLARGGELPASKVGRAWRFVRSDLVRFCAGPQVRRQ